MLSLTDCVERFLSNRSTHCSRTTLVWYAYILREFSALYNTRAPSQIDARALEAYILRERERTNRGRPALQRPLSPSTIAGEIRALKVFFRWLARLGLIPSDPSVSLLAPTFAEPPKSLSVAQLETLAACLAAGDWPQVRRDQAIFFFLLDTGCRAAEALALSLGEELCLEGGYARVKGKGARTRFVGLTAPTLSLLRSYLGARETGPLWLDRFGDRWTYAGLYFAFQRLGSLCGVKVSPHRLRHSFASLYLDQQGQVAHLQVLLGHADARTTERYTQAARTRAALDDHHRHSPALLIADRLAQGRLFNS